MTVKELIAALSELDSPDVEVSLEVGVFPTTRSRRPKVVRLAIEEVCFNATVPDYEGQQVEQDYVSLNGTEAR